MGVVMLRAYVLDPLERAGWTFLQQLLPLLLVLSGGATLASQPWASALDAAGFSAVVSLLLSVLTFRVPKLSPFVDYLLRVARTYVASLVGLVTADQFSHSLIHASWVAAATTALFATLLAAAKGAIALNSTATDGASTLPVSKG